METDSIEDPHIRRIWRRRLVIGNNGINFINNVIEILKPASFYKEAHQEIYAAIKELFEDSEPIDILTVTNRLRNKSKLDIVGGAYYITNLTTRVQSAANVEYHARIISDMSIRRDLIKISSEIQHDAFELAPILCKSLLLIHLSNLYI